MIYLGFDYHGIACNYSNSIRAQCIKWKYDFLWLVLLCSEFNDKVNLVTRKIERVYYFTTTARTISPGMVMVVKIYDLSMLQFFHSCTYIYSTRTYWCTYCLFWVSILMGTIIWCCVGLSDKHYFSSVCCGFTFVTIRSSVNRNYTRKSFRSGKYNECFFLNL